MTVVVVVQALAFADGGLTALGYNTLNMAIVPAFGGYAIFAGLRRLLPANATGVVVATALASGLSVVLAAMAFSIQWLLGATVPIPFDTVFGAMVGVHLLIGVGEGVLSGLAVGAVLAARPDLVYGVRDMARGALADRPRVRMRAFLAGGVVVALLFAVVVSQFAGDDPDGLERVAEDVGFDEAAGDHALEGSIFADYATAGVSNEPLSLAVAGVAGVAITLVVALGLAAAVRDRRRTPDEPSQRAT